MNTDILVPISFIILLGVIVKLLMTAQGAKRKQWHETLQLAMQKDYPLPVETWQRFLLAVDPKRADLRRGLLFLALSLGLLLIGLLVPFSDQQGNQVFLVMAIIPFIVGITYIAFWHFWYRNQE